MGRWAELGNHSEPTPDAEELRREIQLRRPVTQMELNLLAADLAELQVTISQLVSVNQKLSSRLSTLERRLRDG